MLLFVELCVVVVVVVIGIVWFVVVEEEVVGVVGIGDVVDVDWVEFDVVGIEGLWL